MIDLPDEGYWKCGRCDKGVCDTPYSRMTTFGHFYVPSEMLLCESCAGKIYGSDKMSRICKVVGKLPIAELAVLTMLKDKPWKSGEGWVYNNNSQQTRRVLDNLCRKGLAHKKDLTKKLDLVPTFYFTVTQMGLEVLQRSETNDAV